MRVRLASTVLTLMYMAAAISGLLWPAPTSSATRRSAGVSMPSLPGARWRGRQFAVMRRCGRHRLQGSVSVTRGFSPMAAAWRFPTMGADDGRGTQATRGSEPRYEGVVMIRIHRIAAGLVAVVAGTIG